ncbi:MAG: ion transporter [Gammaproteobacteria bacterium]|jgi:voltage-gated potassium channel
MTSPSLRQRTFHVIFEADTPGAKAFDVALIAAILLSVTAVLVDTVASVHVPYGNAFYVVEWAFTVLFTVEYVARLWCVGDAKRYARSFYGIVDLLGIVPTYLSLLLPGAQYLLVVRILRVLRVFRVLRLVRYVGEADLLIDALRASRRKIIVFLFSVMALVVVFGSLMYLIEGPGNGFDSIPISIYWAIVTMTTVGYGDISPHTALGRILASFIMITGYGIIAVPTGIVTLELNAAVHRRASTATACPQCGAEGHAAEAIYCYRCGAHMYEGREEAD